MKPGSCDHVGNFPSRPLLEMTEVERADEFKRVGFLAYFNRYRREMTAKVRGTESR